MYAVQQAHHPVAIVPVAEIDTDGIILKMKFNCNVFTNFSLSIKITLYVAINNSIILQAWHLHSHSVSNQDKAASSGIRRSTIKALIRATTCLVLWLEIA